MNKLKKQTISLVFMVFLSTTIQCQEEVKKKSCNECSFPMDLFSNFQLCLGMEKNEVKNIFEHFSIDTTKTSGSSGKTFYKVKKTLNLPDHQEVLMKGDLVFIGDVLYLFNLDIPISPDYRYLSELKKDIEQKDLFGLNKFIYASDRNSNMEKNESCTKLFAWGRSFEDLSIYALNIKFYKNI